MATWDLSRLLKPGVVFRRVVDDEVCDDANAQRAGVVHELDEISERAVFVVHAVVVRDVVAVVSMR